MEGGREKEKGKSCKKREKEVSETEKQTDIIIWEKNALSKEPELCKENCTHTHNKAQLANYRKSGNFRS